MGGKRKEGGEKISMFNGKVMDFFENDFGMNLAFENNSS